MTGDLIQNDITPRSHRATRLLPEWPKPSQMTGIWSHISFSRPCLQCPERMNHTGNWILSTGRYNSNNLNRLFFLDNFVPFFPLPYCCKSCGRSKVYGCVWNVCFLESQRSPVIWLLWSEGTLGRTHKHTIRKRATKGRNEAQRFREPDDNLYRS